MKRGSWQSPRLVRIDILVLIVTLLTQAGIRAWDYGTGNDRFDQSLTLIEEAIPLYGWGIILGVLTFSLALGIALKIHIVVWASHFLLGSMYLILTIGMVISVFDNNPFPWDGIRSGSILLTPMMLHFVLAIRTGPNPIVEEEVIVTETVVKDNA